MLLQLAVDCFTLEEAIDIVREVGDLVDIVEAGTPLILREGVRAIQSLRSLSPDLRILAGETPRGGKPHHQSAIDQTTSGISAWGWLYK